MAMLFKKLRPTTTKKTYSSKQNIAWCLYCSQHDETVKHLFSTYNQVISILAEIKLSFLKDIKLIALCP